ncbi:PD-(D/E)XK motif protein [Microbacterium jiangjiandongii]|uniref:PD-(D/E)XK motif protein n=1 Tax=Microbacterium jiangjiandongii TaxID=3049071 RepID=UPI00214CCA9D|nr:PD-(D/E)XK motif protein [Microbacterium sp. zg.Y843]MCR2816578.1 PD-(D/E)XK motif protein [Microbacterium sp. zg.Y843]
MISYEDVRQRIERLPVSREAGSRNVEWITPAEVVGVARDTEGRLELLLRGPQLVAVSRSVNDASDYRPVFRDDRTSFEATRIVFPALMHFDQVAAFICIELLRNGADNDLPRAFARTEAIIELAIENLTLSNQALIGLVGELLLLEALCRRADDARVAEIIAGWHGWQRSARDLELWGTGIEVKTTTGMASSHRVEGVHQVERSDQEDRLLLVSIGLQRAEIDAGNGFTVPSLVERIASRMGEAAVSPEVIERFIAHVAEYGASSGTGYDHTTQAADPAYAISFLTTFFRAYDMDDAAIRVLRSHDVAAFGHVVDASVRFRVNLAANGPVSMGNPVEGANQVAQFILGL